VKRKASTNWKRDLGGIKKKTAEHYGKAKKTAIMTKVGNQKPEEEKKKKRKPFGERRTGWKYDCTTSLNWGFINIGQSIKQLGEGQGSNLIKFRKRVKLNKMKTQNRASGSPNSAGGRAKKTDGLRLNRKEFHT